MHMRPPSALILGISILFGNGATAIAETPDPWPSHAVSGENHCKKRLSSSHSPAHSLADLIVALERLHGLAASHSALRHQLYTQVLQATRSHLMGPNLADAFRGEKRPVHDRRGELFQGLVFKSDDFQRRGLVGAIGRFSRWTGIEVYFDPLRPKTESVFLNSGYRVYLSHEAVIHSRLTPADEAALLEGLQTSGVLQPRIQRFFSSELPEKAVYTDPSDQSYTLEGFEALPDRLLEIQKARQLVQNSDESIPESLRFEIFEMVKKQIEETQEQRTLSKDFLSPFVREVRPDSFFSAEYRDKKADVISTWDSSFHVGVRVSQYAPARYPLVQALVAIPSNEFTTVYSWHFNIYRDRINRAYRQMIINSGNRYINSLFERMYFNHVHKGIRNLEQIYSAYFYRLDRLRKLVSNLDSAAIHKEALLQAMNALVSLQPQRNEDR